MNAKLCKKLRRAAERATVGKPARRYIRVPARSTRAYRTHTTLRINDPTSTRGVYRAMKRAVASTPSLRHVVTSP